MIILKCNQPKNNVKTYLFVAHIYDEKPIIDKRLTKKYLNQFDEIWLGGDVTYDTGFEWKLKQLDSLLNISKPTTKWAYGNHDIINGRSILNKYTQRPPFYVTYINGITLLVFDSNYNDQGDCKEVNEQTQFIKMVCDTIQKSTHFIVMGHHVPWGKIENLNVRSFANTTIENRVFKCDTFGFFHNVIYPELVKVQNKNIQVISLAGDMGQKQSTFQFKTKEGVQFLASGLLSINEYNKIFSQYNKPDSVLVFTHNIKSGVLKWEFKPLLQKNQN